MHLFISPPVPAHSEQHFRDLIRGKNIVISVSESLKVGSQVKSVVFCIAGDPRRVDRYFVQIPRHLCCVASICTADETSAFSEANKNDVGTDCALCSCSAVNNPRIKMSFHVDCNFG